ncbi:MAG: hypothetical protein HXY39_01125 [Chloroflexi bacterium]|nr:hypothetical protein [Chloroflexota bacterium]
MTWRTRSFYGTFGVANLGLALYGVLALLNPQILTDSFLARVYQFPPEASAALAYLAALFRLLGFFNLLVGILGLWLLWRHWHHPQPWSERTVITVSLLAYLAPITFDNTVGHIGLFEILEHILFAAMLAVGMFQLFKRTDGNR